MGVYFNGKKLNVSVNIACDESYQNTMRNERFFEVEGGGYGVLTYAFAYAPTITDENYFESYYGVNKNEIVEIKGTCFAYSPSLETMTLPSVTTIGNTAFSGCSNLRYVSLPAIETISTNSFTNCTSLEEINFPNCHTVSNASALRLPSLITIHLGALIQFSQTALRTASNLTYITIGEGTTASLYLQESDKYPQEVLHDLIDHLADMTGQEAKYFSVGETNLAKISAEYMAKLEAKNWNWS